ncbi:MAG: glycosyltransferase family 9 protein [Elusimicrobia bacterium]|nr:glycosyltransferase family 9 protein [Candidatus Obscuribacterium magneticum]
MAINLPFVDKFWVFNSKDRLGLISLIREIRREKYQVVIDFEQWARGTALISYFSGAPIRIGFETPGQFRSGVFTRSFRKNFSDHEINDFFGLISLFKPIDKTTSYEFKETDKGKEELEPTLNRIKHKRTEQMKILIHPGCGKDGLAREWPLVQYALLGNWLMNRTNAQILISGGMDDIQKCEGLNKLLNYQAVNLGGKLSWDGTISLVYNADLVISGNTGIMHLAAALKKNQVALHGPTNSKIWGPLNPNSVVVQTTCGKCPCLKLGFEYHRRDQNCMTKIQLDDVKRAVQLLMERDRKFVENKI